MISTDLLLKGLGGVAVVGGATTVGFFYFRQSKTEDLKTFAARVELVCNGTPTETTGIECSKSTKADSKIKVKKGSTDIEVSAISEGKIKVYKTSKGEDHNKGFKFVIEENDISGTSNNKLEQFETYEIKQDGADWKLIKKTDINAGIKKALGLPETADCDLPTTADVKTCALDDAKFKKIKFEGGSEGRETVPTGTNLKISKVEDSNNDYGTYKFKFVLETTADTKISKTVTIKANTNTEFKIKKDTTSKSLTLEKAWTLDTLRVKVGIDTCSAASGGTGKKECGFTQAKINLFNDASNYTKGASLSSGDSTKKIKVEEGQPGHSQGFKFYTEENDGITLDNGTPNAGSDKKIAKKEASANSPTYEIKEQTPGQGGAKDWYLSKVTNTPAAGA